eukprot:scaffold10047_cov35-Phaeocystis_antarctica.AAC.1
MILSFAVDLRLSCARGGGIYMLHGRSTVRGVWPSVVASTPCKSGCLTGQCAPQSGSEPAASLGWVNRDVRPLAAPLRPSPASQQRRRVSIEQMYLRQDR